jgi:hypothetical protein
VSAKVDEVAIELLRKLVQHRGKELPRIRAEVMQADEWWLSIAVSLVIEIDIAKRDGLAKPVSSAVRVCS